MNSLWFYTHIHQLQTKTLYGKTAEKSEKEKLTSTGIQQEGLRLASALQAHTSTTKRPRQAKAG